MKLPLFKILWDPSDIQAISEVIKRGSYWASGPTAQEFESKVSEYIGSKYVLAFSSGGPALHALMLAHGIGRGDQVIVPAFTFIATAYAPLYTGARPVFADIETDTFCLDPDDVMSRLTKHTRAILPIHYGGIPGKTIQALREIADDHDLLLIEDAAESFGAQLSGQNVGTFGHSGMFSLCQNKVFTTGEGGLVVTDDQKLHNKLKLVRSYGRESKGNYFSSGDPVDYVFPGFNFRMNDITAALGLSQLSRVDQNIQLRQANARKLTHRLKSLSWLETPHEPKNSRCVYQMYTIKVPSGRKNRDSLLHHLKSKQITSKVYFEPVYNYSVFKDLDHPPLENTEAMASQVLTLPFFAGMTDDDLTYLVDSLRGFES